MANLASNLRDESIAYIGEENSATMKAFTEEDWNYFRGLNIDLNKSYFVRGSRETLKKFEAFYLSRCVYVKPSYAHYILSEYIAHVGSVIAVQEEELSFTEKDLLFLYVHDNLIGTGNSEAWVFTAALNKIAIRNRFGLSTIVLSERNVSMLDSSSELISVKLKGSIATPHQQVFTESVVEKEAESNVGKSMADDASYDDN